MSRRHFTLGSLGLLLGKPKLTWGGQASAEVLADHRYDYP